MLREARFIAATRPGYDLDRLEKELPPGLEGRVSIMEIPALAISSTDVRRARARGTADPLPRPRRGRRVHREDGAVYG